MKVTNGIGHLFGNQRPWAMLRNGVDFTLLRRKHPFVVGLVTNDTCNLACIHCRVANTVGYRMSYEESRGHLLRLYDKGARFLYFSGGEPYLWRDGERRLGDLVDLARDIGYARVHLYTNGTLPLDAHPDCTWVSIDGPPEAVHRIRGIDVAPVIDRLRDFDEPYAVVCVLNTLNHGEIIRFLDFLRVSLPGARVMFFFHTPYYGADELLLSGAQKDAAINTILDCKRRGYPVLNSRAALRAIRTGRYTHPLEFVRIVDQTGDYTCCRAVDDPGVCEQCGYAGCAELALSRNLRPGPVMAMLRTY